MMDDLHRVDIMVLKINIITKLDKIIFSDEIIIIARSHNININCIIDILFS